MSTLITAGTSPIDTSRTAVAAPAGGPLILTAAPTDERGAGRFAPSPSGPLHLGNLRTALLAWLWARSRQASFRLRIEDLDRGRSRREHERSQLADLRAIGLDWDGPIVRQSDRACAHAAAFARLRADGLLYPCWCTRAEIRAALSAPHGDSPAYPGTCRSLSAAERRSRARTRPAAWRLDARAQRVQIRDELHGVTTATVDDFVVWREGPGPAGAAYQLAVVLDDHAQAIGEVVRGDDLLSSTPRQALLCHLLGLPVPRYAHVPLMLGPDGARLAKRHGAVTLSDRLARGETIGRVVGYLASSAGLVAPGVSLTPRQLVATFAANRVTRSATRLSDSDV